MATEKAAKKGNGKKPAASEPATAISVRLPFMRATKNTNLYGFERDVLEAMNPQPAVSSVYVRKDALDQAVAVTVSVTPAEE